MKKPNECNKKIKKETRQINILLNIIEIWMHKKRKKLMN